MQKKLIAIIAMIAFGLIAWTTSVKSGDAELVEGRKVPKSDSIERVNSSSIGTSQNRPTANPAGTKALTNPPTPTNSPAPKLLAQANRRVEQNTQSSLLSTQCALRPSPPRALTASDLAPFNQSLPLTRFRTGESGASDPREEIVLANPSNFGLRYLEDTSGRSVQYPPIVVLHETVAAAESTLNMFKTPHARDEDQVSYHALIKEDGTVVYTVPPDRRAFGAGNSSFVTVKREVQTVKASANAAPSVNNFAYHISLVTPAGGRNQSRTHRGYSPEQYQSLAWLVAKTGVSDDRITTHALIDRSKSRTDPRSFNVRYFLDLLNSHPRTSDIPLQCTAP